MSTKTSSSQSSNETSYEDCRQLLDVFKCETEKMIARPLISPSMLTMPPDSLLSLLLQKTTKSKQRSSSSSKGPVEVAVPTFRAILAKRNIVAIEKIGSGAYSKVHLCCHLSHHARCATRVAVKVIDRHKVATDFQQRFLARELEIWSNLRHPNIVRMFEFFVDAPMNRFVFMVSEYLEGGDCLRYVQRQGAVDVETARRWMLQVCGGVNYMHSLNICHRDLKLENLLIDWRGNVKIGDFGFARRFSESVIRGRSLSKTFCGSRAYVAPEILMGTEHDCKKCDVWAIGVIAVVMLTGKMPFSEEAPNRLVVEQQRNYRPVPNETPKDANSFIKAALTFSPSARPSVADLVMHVWIAQPVGSEDSSSSPSHQQNNNFRRLIMQKTTSEVTEQKMNEACSRQPFNLHDRNNLLSGELLLNSSSDSSSGYSDFMANLTT